MFTGFFYALRRKKVPVTITEWMVLMESLSRGYISNLKEFYYLARAILVKSESLFDEYDIAFQEYFKGIESLDEIRNEIWEWLNNPLNRERMLLSPEERAVLDRMDLDELIEEFQKRLKEQDEPHDGGGYWIGRGGTSPFGHSGRNPAGIRVGGASGGRSAIQIAQQRLYRNYRSDLVLDTRQIKIALKGLRQLSRIGPEDELDLDGTVDATSKNAGEIDLKWQRSRKNKAKVLLLMDAGGSMTPYADLVSRLFSAASSISHFKDFQYYYFHNCVYDSVYRDMEQSQPTSTEWLIQNYDREYKVIMVGDACMSPSELSIRYGAIYYYERNEIPGAMWLKKIASHFSHGVWLNPEQQPYWNHPTIILIGKIFPMYELTIDGLRDAVRKLTVKK